MPDTSTHHRVNSDLHVNTLYDIGLKRVPDRQSFDPQTEFLRAVPVSSGGRQAAWFVELAPYQAVLRHYRRGGLIARVVRQRYIWTGQWRTRSWAEYDVLSYLYNKKMPVPRPLAATYWRQGLSYAAAILVERVPHTVTLADSLHTASPAAVAAAVKQVHDAGVWHADLNAYNILLNEAGQVWIIDFDRARRMSMSDKQRQNNLLRLQRSLVKVCKEPGRQWWSEFNRAYLQQHSA